MQSRADALRERFFADPAGVISDLEKWTRAPPIHSHHPPFTSSPNVAVCLENLLSDARLVLTLWHEGLRGLHAALQRVGAIGTPHEVDTKIAIHQLFLAYLAQDSPVEQAKGPVPRLPVSILELMMREPETVWSEKTNRLEKSEGVWRGSYTWLSENKDFGVDDEDDSSEEDAQDNDEQCEISMFQIRGLLCLLPVGVTLAAWNGSPSESPSEPVGQSVDVADRLAVTWQPVLSHINQTFFQTIIAETVQIIEKEREDEASRDLGSAKKVSKGKRTLREHCVLFNQAVEKVGTSQDEDATEMARVMFTRDPRLISHRDDDGLCAIHHMSFIGNAAAVRFLLVCDADINVLESARNTPLHLALLGAHLGCGREHHQVVSALVEQGAVLCHNAEGASQVTFANKLSQLPKTAQVAKVVLNYAESYRHACHVAECGRSGELRRCSKCKLVAYCSAECQRKHWASHRAVCMPPNPDADLPQLP